MSAKKSKSAASARSTRVSRTPAHTESAALARLPKPVRKAFEDARERSHEFALAGLGLVSKARKQSEARISEMVAEGRRVEPKVKKAVEDFKDTLQSRLDVKKLPRLDVKKFKFPLNITANVRVDAA